MDKLGTESKRQKAAREYNEPGFQWTRRVIAISCIFAIIVLPLVAAVFDPTLPIAYGFEETKKGFLFFTSDVEKMHWVKSVGLLLTPLHTHLTMAIAGLYFGSSSVK